MKVVKALVPIALLGGLVYGITICKTLESVDSPQRIFPVNLETVAYRLDDGVHLRHFIDELPFGSLDEVVVLRDHKRIELKPGDPEFVEQEKVYLEKIRPLYLD
ncbi:TPA: hypothetical protein HA241_04700 [Candidatus Woesearchaeota archaeon]|nr:hypothetical protein [Candidatus Woesearchaeota archaeon]